MARLADRRGKSADADAVAAHNRVLALARLVEVGHVHRLRVLRAELEDVAHFNAV